LIAGHSQVKYFDQYLKLSNVDVVSFSGYRIEQMWGVIGHDYELEKKSKVCLLPVLIFAGQLLST
jgi:hypothetical protein